MERLLTRQLAQIRRPRAAVRSIDWDSWGPVVWNCSPFPPYQNCPYGETQSITFKRKCTGDWLSRQKWAFQQYCMSHQHAERRSQRSTAGAATLNLLTGWMVLVENEWPAARSKQNMWCARWRQFSCCLIRELRAKSSMLRRETLWWVARLDLLFRQIGLGVDKFMAWFFLYFTAIQYK